MHFARVKKSRSIFACFRPIDLGVSCLTVTQMDTDIGKWSDKFSGTGARVSQEFTYEASSELIRI